MVNDREFTIALGNFINLVNGWILSSIMQTYEATKYSQKNSSPLAAFILISTTIDFFAGFFEGISDFNNHGKAGLIYKEFVNKYMPGYDSDKLYTDLRCRLAHNFTIGSYYALIHKNYTLHNKVVAQTGQTIINFENFYEDLENAIKKYISDLDIDEGLRNKFLTRYRLGIPAVFQIKAEAP